MLFDNQIKQVNCLSFIINFYAHVDAIKQNYDIDSELCNCELCFNSTNW